MLSFILLYKFILNFLLDYQKIIYIFLYIFLLVYFFFHFLLFFFSILYIILLELSFLLNPIPKTKSLYFGNNSPSLFSLKLKIIVFKFLYKEVISPKHKAKNLINKLVN